MRRTVTLWVALLGLVGVACGAGETIEAGGLGPTPSTTSGNSQGADSDPEPASQDPAEERSLTDTVRDVEDLPSPPWYEGSGIEGLWILTSGTISGEIVAAGLFLEIDTEFASGDSTCNSFSFDRRTRSGTTTVVSCLTEPAQPGEPDLDLIEESILGVIQNGPVLEGDALVFKVGEVELIYERARDWTAEELFSAFTNPDLAAEPDEVFVDDEGGPVRGFQLSRLDHPADDVRFHISVEGDLICMFVSTSNAGGSWCAERRRLVLGQPVFNLGSRTGPTSVRALFIPDPFVEAAATDLAEIGEPFGNIVLVHADAPEAEIVLTNADGMEHVVVIRDG